MNYHDPRCYELALHCLRNEITQGNLVIPEFRNKAVQDLANTIQQAIEDWMFNNITRQED